MADFSVSLHEDDSFCLDHDNRKYLSKNIDADRISENISYEGNVSLEEFYERTFQRAYEEYIQKTKIKHPERVRDLPPKYYDLVIQKQAEGDAELEKAKRDREHGKSLASKKAYTKVAKQIIIQVGNVDDFNGLSPEEQKELREKMRDVLKEYMDTFQTENPNFRIVNAVIHMDEISLSPHLHLTYVPVVEQKRGQTVANSLSGALKIMGYESDKETPADRRFEHCQMKWQTKERERVISIAKKFGLDVGYNKGNKGKGQTIGEYRAAKQAEREAQAAELSAKFNETYIDNQETTISANDSTIEKQEQTINENAIQINQQSKELATVKTELTQKSKELEKTDYIADVINATVDRCEKKMMEELAPASSPDGQYERVTKGSMFGKKQTFVMVPEDDYEVLDKRAGLARSYVQKVIRDHIEPLRKAIMELPVTKRLFQWIDKLQKDVEDRDKEIETLKADKEKLEQEKVKLERQVKIADRVLFRKLNLGRGAVQKMKDEAEQEIDLEQKGRSGR